MAAQGPERKIGAMPARSRLTRTVELAFTIAVTIQLPEGLTADQVKRLRRVADTCPARRALEAGFAFEEEIIVGATRAGVR